MLTTLRNTHTNFRIKLLTGTFIALSLTACGGSSDGESTDGKNSDSTKNPGAGDYISTEAGTNVPVYTVDTFELGSLDSEEKAFDAAYDFAMLNHYFTRSYSNTVASPDLFFDYDDGVSNARTNSSLTTGVMTSKISRTSVDEKAYYEAPQQFGSPLRMYVETTLDVKSQLEFEDPLYVGVVSSSTNGWVVKVETTPSNIYKSEDYSRLLTAGDTATFRNLQNKTASYGWWLESKKVDVISGLLESNTIAQDGTELNVSIKASERALTTSDEVAYLVGDYKVKAGLQSSTIQGHKLQFKAPKITGLTTNVFIPFELKDYKIDLERTCTLKSYSSRTEYNCNKDEIRIKSESNGTFASNKANALFNFEVSEATFPGNWPVLNSGKVTIKDSNGKTAVVTYGKEHISIEFDGSTATAKTWDDVRNSL